MSKTSKNKQKLWRRLAKKGTGKALRNQMMMMQMGKGTVFGLTATLLARNDFDYVSVLKRYNIIKEEKANETK